MHQPDPRESESRRLLLQHLLAVPAPHPAFDQFTSYLAALPPPSHRLPGGHQSAQLQAELLEKTLMVDQLKEEIAAASKLKEEAEQTCRQVVNTLHQKQRVIVLTNQQLARLKSENLILEERSQSMSKYKDQLLQTNSKLQQDYSRLIHEIKQKDNQIATKMNMLNQFHEELNLRQKQLDEREFLIKRRQQEPGGGGKPIQPNVDKSLDKYAIVRSEIPKNPNRRLVKHHTSEIYSLAFNANGSILASTGGDRSIKFYHMLQRKVLATVISDSVQQHFVQVCFSSVGDRAVAACTDNRIAVFDLSGKHLAALNGHSGRVTSVCFNSQKNLVFSGSKDRHLKSWDISKGAVLNSINCKHSVLCVASNNNQPQVAVGLSNGAVRIYSSSGGDSILSEVKGIIDDGVTSVKFLQNRNHILVGTLDGDGPRLLDMRNNKQIVAFRHSDFYNCSEYFHPDAGMDEKYVIAGSSTGSIYHWALDGTLKEVVKGHQSLVASVAYSSITGQLCSADLYGDIIIWN